MKTKVTENFFSHTKLPLFILSLFTLHVFLLPLNFSDGIFEIFFQWVILKSESEFQFLSAWAITVSTIHTNKWKVSVRYVHFCLLIYGCGWLLQNTDQCILNWLCVQNWYWFNFPPKCQIRDKWSGSDLPRTHWIFDHAMFRWIYENVHSIINLYVFIAQNVQYIFNPKLMKNAFYFWR